MSSQPASPERQQRKKSGSAGLHALVKQLDEQYRQQRKDWKNPTPGFRTQAERFAKPRQAVDVMYDVDTSSVGRSSRGSGRHSPWAMSTAPQRPTFKPGVCQKDFYDAKVPDVGPKVGAAAFKSSAPRVPDDPKRFPGQDRLGPESDAGASVTSKNGKGTAGMRSRSPRFDEPTVVCDKIYAPPHGTIAESAEKGKGKGSAWSKNSAPQRPGPPKVLNDKFYDYEVPGSDAAKHNPAKASFAAASPRFPEEKERAPAPGAYTSPLISCGMLRD